MRILNARAQATLRKMTVLDVEISPRLCPASTAGAGAGVGAAARPWYRVSSVTWQRTWRARIEDCKCLEYCKGTSKQAGCLRSFQSLGSRHPVRAAAVLLTMCKRNEVNAKQSLVLRKCESWCELGVKCMPQPLALASWEHLQDGLRFAVKWVNVYALASRLTKQGA